MTNENLDNLRNAVKELKNLDKMVMLSSANEIVSEINDLIRKQPKNFPLIYDLCNLASETYSNVADLRKDDTVRRYSAFWKTCSDYARQKCIIAGENFDD